MSSFTSSMEGAALRFQERFTRFRNLLGIDFKRNQTGDIYRGIVVSDPRDKTDLSLSGGFNITDLQNQLLDCVQPEAVIEDGDTITLPAAGSIEKQVVKVNPIMMGDGCGGAVVMKLVLEIKDYDGATEG